MFTSPPPAAAASASFLSSSQPFPCPDNGSGTKRKRRPAGTPDPDAEVVALSPRTLLESDRYVCEICGQGFQRDQNLQMHRRRHKVPWKLLKRPDTAAAGGGAAGAVAARKRVYVCPEPSCLHHDPAHALGDLVGIKKHFRRKHSGHRQWACARCSKAYAVQSDYKAHLKTCGTRGHSCDCGRVFSRVESFIEHQDACSASRARVAVEPPTPMPVSIPRTASSPSTSSDTNLHPKSWRSATDARIRPPPIFPPPPPPPAVANVELQLLPSTSKSTVAQSSLLTPSRIDEDDNTRLELAIGGPGSFCTRKGAEEECAVAAVLGRLKEEAREQLRLAAAEKSLANEARSTAVRQIEIAEAELANARRIRQQAQAELGRATAVRDRAMKQINSIFIEITCHICRQNFVAKKNPVTTVAASNETAMSHVSSVITGGGEGSQLTLPTTLSACNSAIFNGRIIHDH